MNLLDSIEEILIKSGIKIPKRISMDMQLQKDLNIDSIDLFGLLVEVESVIDVTIEEEEMEPIKNIGEFIALIQKKLGNKIVA